jgi:hypothetical protein
VGYLMFISYSGEDTWVAKTRLLEFVEKLHGKGIKSWFDHDELKLGKPWEQQIRDALIESEVVLLGPW